MRVSSMRKTSKGIFYKCPKCGSRKVEFHEKKTVESTSPYYFNKLGKIRYQENVLERWTDCRKCTYNEKA